MSDFDLGRHEQWLAGLDQRIHRVEKTVAGFDQKLDEVLTHLAEKRGERKMIALFATAMGGVGSFVITILMKLWGPE